MLANTDRNWGSVSKTFHWTLVFLILIEVPVGFLMSGTYGISMRDAQGLALHNLLSQIHHTNGFLILTLATARLVWRVRHVVPATYSRFRAQGMIARTTHVILYGLLFSLPLSGWAALSAFGKAPIWFFGSADLIPPIVPQAALSDFFSYGFFARIHVYSYETGAVILMLHIGAALWHHFIVRDGIFARMWPLARAGD